jgi:hypothetical protein
MDSVETARRHPAGDRGVGEAASAKLGAAHDTLLVRGQPRDGNRVPSRPVDGRIRTRFGHRPRVADIASPNKTRV